MDEMSNAVAKWPGHEYEFSVVKRPGTPEIQAFQKVVYQSRYGTMPEDGRDCDADFLIARDRDGVLAASIRVIPCSKRPFSFDAALDLRSIDGLGSCPAEIGRWCVDERRRHLAESHGLHFGLMKLVFLYGRENGVSDYLICVYPELERFYRGFYFQDAGVGFLHPDWGRVRLYSLNLSRVMDRISESKTSLAKFIIAEPEPNFLIRGR